MRSHRGATIVHLLAGTASVAVVPLGIGVAAEVVHPAHWVGFGALAAGVALVARRRGLETGAYAALLSAAMFAALLAPTAQQHGSGRVLVGAMAAFLACAVLGDGSRRAPATRLDLPGPVSPFDDAPATPPTEPSSPETTVTRDGFLARS